MGYEGSLAYDARAFSTLTWLGGPGRLRILKMVQVKRMRFAESLGQIILFQPPVSYGVIWTALAHSGTVFAATVPLTGLFYEIIEHNIWKRNS